MQKKLMNFKIILLSALFAAALTGCEKSKTGAPNQPPAPSASAAASTAASTASAANKAEDAAKQAEKAVMFGKLKDSAEKGKVQAQYNLCGMYLTGSGTPKNPEQGFYWCEKAANQGHSGAQSRLGALYYTGMGVKQDNMKAIYWLEKAAAKGDKSAKDGLEQLKVFCPECFSKKPNAQPANNAKK